MSTLIGLLSCRLYFNALKMRGVRWLNDRVETSTEKTRARRNRKRLTAIAIYASRFHASARSFEILSSASTHAIAPSGFFFSKSEELPLLLSFFSLGTNGTWLVSRLKIIGQEGRGNEDEEEKAKRDARLARFTTKRNSRVPPRCPPRENLSRYN